MILAILAAAGISFCISWLATAVMIRLAPRIGFIDKPGGRKVHINPRPLGGGVAIWIAFVLPMLACIVGLRLFRIPVGRPSTPYLTGALQQTPIGLTLIGTLTAIHILGLIDDRKALGPYMKLLVQLAITAAMVIPFREMRVLTALDGQLGMHGFLSCTLSVLWIAAITNAFNFLDNMDGLSAGVAAVSATAFLVATISIHQWFVAGSLALLLGSLIGFLWWNFPPAKIFMGDSGSLVIGMLLGVLTVRTTYLTPGTRWGAGWYGVFMPVVVMAVPLYDLFVVSAIRMSRGKSPFVGDTNHFSHRLVSRGMSRRTAVLCLYLITAATAIGGVLLPHVSNRFAALMIAMQTLLILGVVALLEQHPIGSNGPTNS